MWIWITTYGAARVRGPDGYFNCPGCRSRQPCTVYELRSRTYLYGLIPISTGEPVGPETYRCAACRHDYVADGATGYDFGEHCAARTWRCFKCGHEIAYERFDCPSCGYTFDVGGRT